MPRDTFLAVLSSGPLLAADAIVVLCGEDAAARLATGVQLFASQAAPWLVLSGGRHEPPRSIGADALLSDVLGRGVAPDRVLRDATSQNTHEQAVNVAEMAARYRWRRLLLVASPYHVPRAFLTFLAVLRATKQDTTVRVIPVPCADVPWFQSPPGVTETRAALLAVEYAKIDAHQSTGDVATYAQGLDYLKWWEGK
jgi:uncharacterized SAM-binding protein YcdF (DUF218 family)